MGRGQRALVLAVLLVGQHSAPVYSRFPRHMVWRGTLTDTQGHTAQLRARAHVVYQRDAETLYIGRLHCSGDACLRRRFHVHAESDEGVPGIFFLKLSGAGRILCGSDQRDPPLDLSIRGHYVCSRRRGRLSFKVLSEGELSLLPSVD